MKDAILDLLWKSPDVMESISKFLPAYQQAQRDFYAAVDQMREQVSPELFDRLQDRFFTFTNYEVCAYYAFGLGLREALIRELFL